MPKAKLKIQSKNAPKTVKKALRTLSSEESSTKSLARSIARTLGTLGGGMVGGPLGSKLGGDAGEWIAKVTGFGDYNVEGNALLKEQVPSFMSAEDGIIITHKEYIGDIFGSTGFVNQGGKTSAVVPWSGLINPGNSLLFPWLSTIAQSFEMFSFQGLIFDYKSTSSNALNSTNTALGVVIMTTNYDVLDNDFSTKQQAEAYEFTCSTAPSASVIHPVECKPGKNVLDRYYVTGIESVNVLNGDPRIYYMGNFQIMTQGMQAAADIGELWVSYKVKLIRPKLPTPLNSNIPYTHISASCSASSAWGNITYKSGSTLTVNLIPITGQMYFPSNGWYFINIYSAPAYNSTGLNPWIAIGGANYPQVLTSQSGVSDANALGTTSALTANTVSLPVAPVLVAINNNSTDGITLPNWSNATGNNWFDIIVIPISSGLTAKNPFADFIKNMVAEQLRNSLNDRSTINQSLPLGRPLLVRQDAILDGYSEINKMIDLESDDVPSSSSNSTSSRSVLSTPVPSRINVQGSLNCRDNLGIKVVNPKIQ